LKISSEANGYLELRRRVQPFAYFWKTKPGLIDSFIRESDAYRRAVDGRTRPDDALAQLKSDKEFMAKLRAEKTRLQAGFVAIDPATGQVKAWVGSRDFKTDQFDHVVQAQRQGDVSVRSVQVSIRQIVLHTGIAQFPLSVNKLIPAS